MTFPRPVLNLLRALLGRRVLEYEAIRVRALLLDEPGEDGRERVFASVEKADRTVVLVAEGSVASPES